jgi:hypothetical protein
MLTIAVMLLPLATAVLLAACATMQGDTARAPQSATIPLKIKIPVRPR